MLHFGGNHSSIRSSTIITSMRRKHNLANHKSGNVTTTESSTQRQSQRLWFQLQFQLRMRQA